MIRDAIAPKISIVVSKGTIGKISSFGEIQRCDREIRRRWRRER